MVYGGSIVAFAAGSNCPAASGPGAILTGAGDYHSHLRGAHVLQEYESGLTQPLIVNGWRAGEEIEFTYRLCPEPGFQLKHTTHLNGQHAADNCLY